MFVNIMSLLALLSNFGGPDLIIILLIVLVLFGAKKLPELAKGMGQAVKEFQKAKDEFSDELHNAGNATPPSPMFVRPTLPCRGSITLRLQGKYRHRAKVLNRRLTSALRAKSDSAVSVGRASSSGFGSGRTTASPSTLPGVAQEVLMDLGDDICVLFV